MNFIRGVKLDNTGFLHSNMGINAIRAVFQYQWKHIDWNAVLDLQPGERLTGSMARKTFATMGVKYIQIVCISGSPERLLWK